jgi:hypothetical protein
MATMVHTMAKSARPLCASDRSNHQIGPGFGGGDFFSHLRRSPIGKFLIVRREVSHQRDHLGILHHQRQRPHARRAVAPLLRAGCDTARQFSLPKRRFYRTLSYFVGTIGTLQERGRYRLFHVNDAGGALDG